MLVSCPECGNSISDTSKECIHCGVKLKKCKECNALLIEKDNKTFTLDFGDVSIRF